MTNKHGWTLLPCPFCGSDAEVGWNKVYHDDGHAWCTNERCGCDMYAETAAKVVEMWNRRPGDGDE